MRGAFPGDPPPSHEPLSHLALVANADLYLIAPASANTLAKLAHGLADNLLTSAALAAECPLVVAPAMNHHMWRHPATRANVALLSERGAYVIEPEAGRLASAGEWGEGRLAEPDVILAAAEAQLGGLPDTAGELLEPVAPGPWADLRVLVTAGGTREPIDSVRFVGNRSSGRMGFALADAARARGAQVMVVAANVELPRSEGIGYVDVQTAAELRGACLAAFPACDVLLMAAAVADFRPSEPAAGKIKKARRKRIKLRLEPTVDVLAELGTTRREGQTLVGFAAEHGDRAVQYGRDKLVSKRLDAIVVNDVSQPEIGFESPDNEVTIVTAEGDQLVPQAPKSAVAEAVLDVVTRLRHPA